MKLIKIIELYKKLTSVKQLAGRDLNYTIEKNISKLQIEIDFLTNEENKIVKITKDFNDELEALRRELATVDGEVKTKDIGNGIIIFDFPESVLPELEKRTVILIKLHENAIDEQKIANEEYLKMLHEKDCDFKITKVSLKNIPETISSENMKLIFDIIEE